MHMPVWQPEVNTGHLPLSYSLLFCERVLLWLASESKIHLSLPSSTGVTYRCILLVRLLYRCWGFKFRSTCLFFSSLYHFLNLQLHTKGTGQHTKIMNEFCLDMLNFYIYKITRQVFFCDWLL